MVFKIGFFIYFKIKEYFVGLNIVNIKYLNDFNIVRLVF